MPLVNLSKDPKITLKKEGPPRLFPIAQATVCKISPARCLTQSGKQDAPTAIHFIIVHIPNAGAPWIVIGNAPPSSFVDTEGLTLSPSTSAPEGTSAKFTSEALSETVLGSASSAIITSAAEITSATAAAVTSASEIIKESESFSHSDSLVASVTVTSTAPASTSNSASDGIECPDESGSVSSDVSVTSEIGAGAFASVTDGSQTFIPASASVSSTKGSSESVTASAAVTDQSTSASASSSAPASSSASASTPANPSSSSSSTPTSALVGSDGLARCTDYKCNSGADWLVSALCAISKCNHMWPLSLVFDIEGDLYDATRAAFTVWSAPLQPVTSVITFDKANTALADNSAEGGWLGGALDVASA
ncbi:hypothetical protein I312_101211 [Cryptococcus bacillisporus CA1280]|uniref:uncharacterized protein n=1 Tax=Cryptococcus bacillisporus CA1280 TaxID=1296109 RepID=UPI0033684E48